MAGPVRTSPKPEVLEKMKVLSGLMLFILCGVYATAQQEAKVIAEVAAGNEKLVRNAPFSAEAISESVQTLADGNRIVRSNTSKLYRNSEGRFRREISGGSGGVLGTSYGFGHGISIMDPVVGHRLMLDAENMTARVLQLGNGRNIAIAGTAAARKELTDAQRAGLARKGVVIESKPMTEEQRAEYMAKAEELRKKTVELRAGLVATFGDAQTVFGGNAYAFTTSSQGKYDTRSEELGTRDFDGIAAEGTRKITTIPAGAIGNERPIEIVYERWYSKELELVVYSKQSDPRFGEQTYRLTNIVRSEPDPSLFTVPQGYRLLTEPANVYRFPSPPRIPAQSAGSPRPARAPRAVNVSATKP